MKNIKNLNKEKCKEVADILKILANPLRLAILCYLGTEEKSVGELEIFCQVSQSQISQSLAIMRHKNIVTFRKEGNVVYYRISDPKIAGMMNFLYDMYCSQEKGPWKKVD